MISPATLRKFALSLPGVEEKPHFHLASFRVGGRIFMTLPPEGDHARVFLDEQQREVALAVHADCVAKLWWGKSVCGLRVDLAKASAQVAKDLVRAAWQGKGGGRHAAPKARRGRAS